MTDKTSFDEWAIIELFGHHKIAGRVTEATIGGGSFIRVDVPDSKGRIAFTKFYGPTAIYAMSPCEESVATAAAQHIDANPVKRYELTQLASTTSRDMFDEE